MALEVELSFEGVVDGLDDLAQGSQELLAAARALTLASGTDQRDIALGELGLESGTVVVLVGDDHLTVLGGLVHGGQYREQGLALVGLGPGQGPAHRKTVNGAHQVQAQAPEEA